MVAGRWVVAGVVLLVVTALWLAEGRRSKPVRPRDEPAGGGFEVEARRFDLEVTRWIFSAWR